MMLKPKHVLLMGAVILFFIAGFAGHETPIVAYVVFTASAVLLVLAFGLEPTPPMKMMKAFVLLTLAYSTRKQASEKDETIKELKNCRGVTGLQLLQASELPQVSKYDVVLTVEAKDVKELKKFVYGHDGIRFVDGVTSVEILVWA